MDLQPATTSFEVNDDRAWKLDDHGVGANITVTIDTSLFGPSHKSEDGRHILSGVALAPTAGDANIYGPAGASSEGGGEDPAVPGTAVGHLFSTIRIPARGDYAGAALYWHGVVDASLVPGGIDAGNRASSRHIFYRNTEG